MTDEKQGWQGGFNAFGDFAPALVHYTDRVLFDEVWERPELSPRDRSFATVAAPGHMMAHYAILEADGDAETPSWWGEQVTDEEFEGRA